MKKITLSAAVLAMTMMGCSDMGLDNSVASTNEVKSEPTQQTAYNADFLAKSATGFYRDEELSGGNYGNNNNGYERYAYEVGIEVQMQSYIDYGGVTSIGAYHVMNAPYRPDVIRVMTLPLYHCRLTNNQTDAYCHKGDKSRLGVVTVDNKTMGTNIMGATAESAELIHPSIADPNEANVISSFTAIWNQGRSDEVILTAVTYNGPWFQRQVNGEGKKLAKKAYQKYFLPAVADYFNHN